MSDSALRSTDTTELTLTCADGVSIQARLFEPSGTIRGHLLIAPALAVPQRFYADLATCLALAGWRVMTFDYRGTGLSEVSDTVLKASDLQIWGEQDTHAALGRLVELGPDQPLCVLGHSLGCQLPGMSAHARSIDACVWVGAGMPHWRRWPLAAGLGLQFLWWVLIPLAAAGRLRFPARTLRLGSEDVPAAAMRQWARWARHPDYLFATRFNHDYPGYAALDCPLQAIHMTDDRYASEAALQALLQRVPNAEAKVLKLSPEQLGQSRLGHFGYFRRRTSAEDWPRLVEWLNQSVQQGGG